MSLRNLALGSQVLVLLLLVLIAAFAAAGKREASTSIEADPQTDPRDPGGYPLPLVFPLGREGLLTDSFGDPRPGERRHQGVDIMASKMTPVTAAAAGEVTRIAAGKACCALTLRHDDGWTTRYLHLNNDTAGTDDGLGHGIASGIEVGTRVEAGLVIGWVGDSGNAEATAPHLHFELRNPDHETVDPYPSLHAALRGSLEAL
jgi:murein DD-endopeptidase MepM/ murein hydrolase activator NlpD